VRFRVCGSRSYGCQPLRQPLFRVTRVSESRAWNTRSFVSVFHVRATLAASPPSSSRERCCAGHETEAAVGLVGAAPLRRRRGQVPVSLRQGRERPRGRPRPRPVRCGGRRRLGSRATSEAYGRGAVRSGWSGSHHTRRASSTNGPSTATSSRRSDGCSSRQSASRTLRLLIRQHAKRQRGELGKGNNDDHSAFSSMRHTPRSKRAGTHGSTIR
jgi:hypothetical protein